MRLLIATSNGLHELGDRTHTALEGEPVTAVDGGWALAGMRRVYHRSGSSWSETADLGDEIGNCVLGAGSAVLVGTAEAHLVRVDESGRLARVTGFDEIHGRDEWFTPWGGPADTRSLARDAAGRVYANVHVGGVARSDDDGTTWEPTALPITADVHEVVAGDDLLLAPAAVGLATTRDAGRTWDVATRGMHATYLRAAALAGDWILVGCADSHMGGRAAVYRRPADGGAPFEKAHKGLPEWFDGHIDTGCLDARGETAAFGTEDGDVFVSSDGGRSWTKEAAGLPSVTCVRLD